MLLVRAAQKEDLPSLVALLSEQDVRYWASVSAEDQKRIADGFTIKANMVRQGHAAMLVGEVNGSLVGYAAACLSGRRGHVEFAVSSSFRRFGFGIAMLTDIAIRCKRIGAEELYAICRPENIPARELLRAAGFEYVTNTTMPSGKRACYVQRLPAPVRSHPHRGRGG